MPFAPPSHEGTNVVIALASRVSVVVAADNLLVVAMSDALTATWKAMLPPPPQSARGYRLSRARPRIRLRVHRLGHRNARHPHQRPDHNRRPSGHPLDHLLHQAAHGLLAASGSQIGDGRAYPDEISQGNAGRYHNKSYRDAAQIPRPEDNLHPGRDRLVSDLGQRRPGQGIRARSAPDRGGHGELGDPGFPAPFRPQEHRQRRRGPLPMPATANDQDAGCRGDSRPPRAPCPVLRLRQALHTVTLADGVVG